MSRTTTVKIDYIEDDGLVLVHEIDTQKHGSFTNADSIQGILSPGCVCNVNVIDTTNHFIVQDGHVIIQPSLPKWKKLVEFLTPIRYNTTHVIEDEPQTN